MAAVLFAMAWSRRGSVNTYALPRDVHTLRGRHASAMILSLSRKLDFHICPLAHKRDNVLARPLPSAFSPNSSRTCTLLLCLHADCAMSYAGMAEFVEDLQRYHTGTYLIALLVFALIMLMILATMIRVKGRRVGILDGLNSDKGGTTPPKLPSPGTASLGAAPDAPPFGAASHAAAAESLA